MTQKLHFLPIYISAFLDNVSKIQGHTTGSESANCEFFVLVQLPHNNNDNKDKTFDFNSTPNASRYELGNIFHSVPNHDDQCNVTTIIL